MKVISSATLKGGTGKTMVAVNLAGLLAEKYKVLAADFDPQCNLSDNMGIDTTDQSIKSVRDIFEDPDIDPRDIIQHGLIKELPNLDVIPSNLSLTDTEMRLVSRAGREQILGHYIEDHMDVFSEYDYIFADTNPSMGIINQNVFLASDSVILVSDVSRKAVQGAQLFTYLWGKNRANLRKENNVKALVINNYDKRIKLAGSLIEFYQDDDEFAPLLVQQPIPSRVKLKDTELKYKPINVLYPNSEETEFFRNVLDELKEKGVL